MASNRQSRDMGAVASGEPRALIATTEKTAFTATSSGHWEEFAFTSPLTKVGGVKYWLDAGLTDKVNVALTGTTSPSGLSDAEALRCIVLKLTGTHPNGAYEVHWPTNRKIYVVWNSTVGDITFKTGGQRRAGLLSLRRLSQRASVPLPRLIACLVSCTANLAAGIDRSCRA